MIRSQLLLWLHQGAPATKSGTVIQSTKATPSGILLLILELGEQGRPELVIAATNIALNAANRDPARIARGLG